MHQRNDGSTACGKDRQAKIAGSPFRFDLNPAHQQELDHEMQNGSEACVPGRINENIRIDRYRSGSRLADLVPR